MEKKSIIDKLQSGLVYLDGATGSNLLSAGMPLGVCPEQWILEHKEVLYDLQKSYSDVGADIVYASTFTCNRIKLEEYGLADKLYEMNRELVELTRSAVGQHVYVAGDITMTGRQLEPVGDLSFEELVDVYKEQVDALAKAGVDLFIVETMMSLQETRAAVLAIKETTDIPFMVTMTFEENGKCLFGTDPITAAVVMESLGACAVGANCSTGPAGMTKIISEMHEYVEIPIIAKPNAGLPVITEDNEAIYEQTPEMFSNEMKGIILAGASVVGGCCGTTPEHIEQLLVSTKNINVEPAKRKNLRYLTSETKTFSFGLDENFIVIGERINPTGKKKLQEELRNNKFELALQYAEEQVANGAKLLDINVGMSGIDELDVMLQMIRKVSMQTNTPLVIDSSHIEVIEAALRIYPGRALINSISLEKVKIENLLPIAKKYGAMFILLPLSDAGLPESKEEKIQIIDEIVERAYKIGLSKKDIIVDGLVTTVGANPKAALETLETIRYCKKNDLATTFGLSNISFGLPARIHVNTAFLTLAIREGLTTAIANPSQELLLCGALASDLLLNKEHAAERYIEYVNDLDDINISKSKTKNKEETKKDKAKEEKKEDLEHNFSVEEENLYISVVKGKKEQAIEVTKELIEEEFSPNHILDSVLIPAIDKVGENFDNGIYFLPQLIAGAEAMKTAIDVLEPYLIGDSKEEQNSGTIVIATVEGDIHDIGKNLVALMLKIYGFKVYDLGKDVPKEEIVKKALEVNADIICLSALMTTTMQQMKTVIEYAREKDCHSKVMIGGAVITQGYADDINADGYSEDAAAAVVLAKKIMGEKNGR